MCRGGQAFLFYSFTFSCAPSSFPGFQLSCVPNTKTPFLSINKPECATFVPWCIYAETCASCVNLGAPFIPQQLLLLQTDIHDCKNLIVLHIFIHFQCCVYYCYADGDSGVKNIKIISYCQSVLFEILLYAVSHKFFCVLLVQFSH